MVTHDSEARRPEWGVFYVIEKQEDRSPGRVADPRREQPVPGSSRRRAQVLTGSIAALKH